MIGDEILPTEDTYLNKIGNLVTTIDILVKRIAAKDQRIIELEGKLSESERKAQDQKELAKEIKK